LFCARFSAWQGGAKSPDPNDIVVAVLPHQLAVLHRQVMGPRYTPTDRMILATLTKLILRNRWPIFLVTQLTLLRWHGELIRLRRLQLGIRPGRSG
jgi:hypothetical protein